MSAPQKATRERLVEAAERLFADGGLEGVSLRRVAAAAGVNSAAVHYHFGSREALVEAVVMNRLARVQARREELLAAVREANDPHDLRRLVEVLVLPLAELVQAQPESGRAYIRLLSKLYRDPQVLEIVTRHFGASYLEIGDWAAVALPQVPRPVLNRRLRLIVQCALAMLADPDVFRGAGGTRVESRRAVAETVDFLVGALCGPPAPAAART